MDGLGPGRVEEANGERDRPCRQRLQLEQRLLL